MTAARTPHGALIPENFNQLGRAPRGGLDVNNPQIRAFLTEPNLAGRLAHIARTDPALFTEISTDLLQHRRVMEGGRALPGQYNGRNDQPYEVLPFQPKDDWRPDRRPGTEAHKVTRQAVERLDADLMAPALAARLRSHDSDSPDSTWNRMAPAAERAASTTDRPPSLRDTVAASFDSHVNNSGD